jgi:hypothetical protein
MNANPTEPIVADPLAWTAPPPRGTSKFTWIALGISLVAFAGSFWLNPKLAPTLGWSFQRALVLAVTGILGLGLLTTSGRASPLSLLALPAAVGSLALALLEVYRYEITGGREEQGSALIQDLFTHGILVGILVFDVFRCGPGAKIPSQRLLMAAILGVLLAAGAVLAIQAEPKPNKTFSTVGIPLYGPK